MARRKLRARLDAERTLEAEARALRERDVPVGDVGEAESGAIPSIDSPGRASSVDESWELEESLADSSLADCIGGKGAAGRAIGQSERWGRK